MTMPPGPPHVASDALTASVEQGDPADPVRLS